MIAKFLPSLNDRWIAPVTIFYIDYEGDNRSMTCKSLDSAMKALDRMFDNTDEFAIKSAAAFADTANGFEAVLTIER